MAAYKDLIGQKITKVTSNPSEPKTGQMWYNSTDGKLRGLGILEATRSAAPMINKRSLFGFGVGTDTAGLVVAGLDDSTYLTATEEWNGSGWAAGGAYPNARYGSATAGTQTAAISYCGRQDGSPGPGSPTETYNYNGSSWSSGNSFPTASNSLQGIGAVNTAVVSTQASDSTNMYHWNGTSWTSANARNTAKGGQAAFGTQTAAVLAGGSNSNITEVYDGTNWTSGNTMNTSKNQIAGSGTQTDGLAFGGDAPPSEAAQTSIESWDGTSWSTSPATLATAKTRAGTGRNTASGTWIAGGIGPGGGGEGFDGTEEYEKSTNTITAAAWSSGGTYPYAAANTASLGPATAMLTCGGNNSGPTKQTTVNLYNGTSYSAETGIPAATNGMGSGKGGTETAGLIFGGSAPGGNTTATILYNGSSWTSGGALSTARRNLGGLGISTAALAFGGQEPSYSTATEEYGGSSWTSGGTLPAARRNPTGVGSQTAGLVLGGQSPPAAGVNTSFTYNGTSYSGGPTMINSRSDGASSGPNSSNTSALVYGGSAGAPPYTVILPTESYDGSAFSTAPSLSTGRDGDGSGSSASEGVQVAGYIPSGSYSSATEQFTPESTAANIADFTTS